MMTNKKSVTIIGGGTAGYMSAAFFKHQGYDVTIIYNNTENPRLVVGESLTANTFFFLENLCGFKRSEWILGSDAIHKNGVLYKNWGKAGESYINGWRKDVYTHEDYINSIGKTYQEIIQDELYVDQVNDTNKTLFSGDNINTPVGFDPKSKVLRESQNASDVPYGIQLDALKLTEFIKGKLGDTITTITDLVTDVVYDGTKVTQIKLKTSGTIDTEFVVDASGFAKVVAKTSPLFEAENISDIVFTSRALFTIIEYKDREAEMKPRTGTFCGKHGWAWHTPTAKRIGSGYVFNSEYCTDEEALQDYCDVVDIELTDELRESVAYISFPNIRTKDILMDNILCVGMSSGFIEPMEAPSLLGVQLTLLFYPKLHNSPEIYNKKMADYVRAMCKFIGIRYKSSKHQDTPFWKFVHNQDKYPEIMELIRKWKVDGYTDITGHETGDNMPPRCFDDLIRSSVTPNIKLGNYKHPDNMTMAEYLEKLEQE